MTEQAGGDRHARDTTARCVICLDHGSRPSIHENAAHLRYPLKGRVHRLLQASAVGCPDVAFWL